MIISHKYKFIYIKTLKTAGTSLEIALSKFCDNGDIITQIDKQDENTRKNLGFTTAQNYRPKFLNLISDLKYLTRTEKGIVKYFNHMPATMVRDRISQEQWNDYYKFTTVRDPYDLAISLYYWKKKSHPDINNVSDFLRIYGHHLYRNTQIVSENNTFLLNDYARYENLEIDLERIGSEIGLPENLWEIFRSIKAKGNIRKRDINTVHKLTKSEKDIIKFICNFEFSHYGYEQFSMPS